MKYRSTKNVVRNRSLPTRYFRSYGNFLTCTIFVFKDTVSGLYQHIIY